MGATVLVVLARWLAEPVLGGALPLVTLFAGVAIAVWVGGRGPALLTAVLGYAACEYLFVVPREGADPTRFVAGFAVALATCGIIIASGEAMRTARAAARANSALLRTALGSITDGVIVTGPDGRVVYVNPVAEALTGWMRDEADGRPLEHVFRMIDESTGGAVELPADDTGWLPAVATVDRAVLVGRDGVARPLEARAATLRDPYDAAVGSVVVFRDVGEQRRAERALASSERGLRDFFENASVGLNWVGPDGIVLRVNQAELDLLGYTRDEYVGRPMTSFHVDPRDALDILARLHAGETLRDRPARLRAKDGTTKEVLIDCNVLRDGDRFVHTRCITRDVTAQRCAEAALRESESRYRALAQSLAEAGRRKNEFIATLVHELRNPLAPMQNAVAALKGDVGRDARVEWWADLMARQIAQMSRLLEDLMEASRLAHDKLELRTRRLDLRAVIADAVEASRPVIDAAGHALRVDVGEAPLPVDGDAARLTQVFCNLLHNAAKYTPPRGHIALAVERRNAAAVVTVTDSGVGIDAATLPCVFDWFAQGAAPPEAPAGKGGLGVGLAIVRALVEAHGGSVAVQSAGAGKGSAFVVSLPLAAGAPEGLAPAAGNSNEAAATWLSAPADAASAFRSRADRA